jgi:dihydroflavonol-4-reductase
MSAPILVTGGAGFMGNWLVRSLIAKGESVRVLDLPSACWDRLPVGRIEIVAGSICDRAALAAAVRGCRGVVHLAGLPQLWMKRRGHYRQVHELGTANVLEEALRAGCRRIVHVSSATVWPLPGRAVCRWRDAYGPYSRSKLRAERHALRLARLGAPIVVVSPTLPVGPGDYGRTPPTQLLLNFCRGKVRDYVDTQLNIIDVRDVALGMCRALEIGTPGERYLFGNVNLPLVELFRRLAALTGQPVPRRRVPYAVALLAGVVMEWWADVVSRQTPAASIAGVQLTRRPLPSDADANLQRLGITPRPLEQTLADTVAWFREMKWLMRSEPRPSGSGERHAP